MASNGAGSGGGDDRRNSSEGSSQSNSDNQSQHLFGRMSKKLAQLTRLNRPDPSPSSTSDTLSASKSVLTTKSPGNKKQQIEDLERRLLEAETSIRERLEIEWKRKDLEIRKLLDLERLAETEKLSAKIAGLEAKLAKSEDDHRRAMDDTNVEWRTLESDYRRQIDELSVKCARAVSELKQFREQQELLNDEQARMSSRTMTADDVPVASDVTDDSQSDKKNEDGVNLEDIGPEEKRKRLKEQMSETESLQSQLDDANQSLVTLAITLSELREEHEEEHRCLQEVQQEVQKDRSENSRLTDMLNVQKNRIVELEGQKTNAEELVRELSQSMDKLKRKMQALEARIQSSECNSAQLEAKGLEEINRLRKNLDEVLEAKKLIEEKYDFLRNCNAQQEQQMLDDYEWKLREIERSCKNQTEKLKETHRKLLEEKKKMALETTSQASEMQKREEKIAVTEAELRQLRGFSSELQKGMKAASTQVDQMRLLELRLRGELRDTKTQLQEAQDLAGKLQADLEEAKASSDRRLRAKEVTLKYGHDERLKELTVEWDKRLKEESLKLKNDLEAEYAQQKIQDLQELSLQKDEEMADVIRDYEQRFQRLNTEVATMTATLENTEKQLTDEIYLIKMASNTKTNELQRRLESQESECQKKDADLRSREKQLEDVQMQLAAHRATLDLVRVEAEKSKDDDIELLRGEQERQLERVRREYEDQLQEALEMQLKSHKAQLHMARIELEKTMDVATQKQKDQHECIAELKEALNEKEEAIERLNEEVQRLQIGLSKMSTELDFHGREILRVRHEASRQLRVAVIAAAMNGTVIESDESSANDGGISVSDRRPEDVIAIRQLREALVEKDRQVKKLQEENQKLQIELSQKMDHYRQLSTSQPVVSCDNAESMSVPKRNNKRFKDSSKRLSAPILGSPLMEGFYTEPAHTDNHQCTSPSKRLSNNNNNNNNQHANKHRSQKRK